MTSGGRIPQVCSTACELQGIVQSSKVATADKTHMKESDFAAQIARGRCFDDLRRGSFDVLSEQAVDALIEDKHENRHMEDAVAIPENESNSEPGYAGPAHCDAGDMLRETRDEREKQRSKILIDNRFEKMFLALFRKA